MRPALASAEAVAEAAARTVETSACLILTMSSEMVPSGLWMKSTAPSSSASNVASAPALVSEETITTGFGRCTMMRERQVRPSISGMLMSSVITSGLNASSSRNASIPLRTASTVKSPSASNNCTRWRRINAESSTISNLITASPLLLVLETRRQLRPSRVLSAVAVLQRVQFLHVEQLVDVEQQDHSLLRFQIGDPPDQLLLLGRELRRATDEASSDAHHLGHRIDNEAGAYPRDGEHHDALSIVAFDTLQAEPAPLIHHGQHDCHAG